LNIEIFMIIKVKDNIIAVRRIKQPGEHKLNPGERTSQKGSAAHEVDRWFLERHAFHRE
jgi:hypothetical protein